jgi:LAO/AO transport system kinase
MDSRPDPVETLFTDIRSGSRSALGRGLTLVESTRPEDEPARLRLLDLAGAAAGRTETNRVAVTGVPGSGKSTLIERLGLTFVRSGRRVAVLAVDPTSERTGGSILGDKTRMERLAASEQAFIRPSPTRGHAGGVASTTRESAVLCEAAGYDTILIETVGVGQSETRVTHMVDLVLLLVLGGAGDSLQGIKRGILEMADFIAVNKVDGDRSESGRRAAAELRQALHLLRPDERHPRFVRTLSALEGVGVDELADDVDRELMDRRADGRLDAERARQRVVWFESALDARLRGFLRTHPGFETAYADLADDVRLGRTDPESAARDLLAQLLNPASGSPS